MSDPSMKRLVGIAFALAACGKDKAASAPEPFKGPLTVAKVMAAKDVVKPLDAWEPALVKLQSVVGVPTKVDGDKHYWAAMEGDSCAYFEVRREDGKEYGKQGPVVGVTSNPMTVDKDGAIMNRAECLKLVGKGVAPEDPNAEGPDYEQTYQVAEVVKLAVAGRSKWKGKQINVVGRVRSITTSTGSAPVVTLADTKDETVTISCKLPYEKLETSSDKPLELSGFVEINEFVRGDGTPGIRADLVNCGLPEKI